MAPISDIIGVKGENEFVRTIYAGNAICTVKTADSPVVFTVRGTSFAPCELSGSAAVEEGKPSILDILSKAFPNKLPSFTELA